MKYHLYQWISHHLAWVVQLTWALVMGLSLTVALEQQNRQSEELAKTTARANFKKDLAFRAWAASHGGVYVPIDANTPPNPYLAHVPERDITTPSGRHLTLMNPAYMMRQMMDQYPGMYGSRGHITSLQLLNPHNAPDAWEEEMLRRFDQGKKASVEITHTDGAPYARLMYPLITERACLKCHAFQGYHVGDVRGGVSVSVPLQPFYDLAKPIIRSLWITYLSIWFVGFVVLYYGLARRKEHLRALHLAHHQLKHLATHDALTQLPNRYLFLEHLDDAITMAAEDEKIGLLFIDLDNFKSINDTQGHLVGDQLLILVAQRLSEHLPSSVMIARLGGDEFVVLIQYDSGDVMSYLETLMALFHRPFLINEHTLFITPSIGISLYPEDASDAQSLIKNADTAMYHAKASGKANYQFYTQELHTQLQERVAMEHDLRTALSEGELYLLFQPQYLADGTTLVGMEALLRWHTPQRGHVNPAVFIPIAEGCGLIDAIDTWVLHHTLTLGAQWYAHGWLHVPLSVNLSAREFMSDTFVERIQEALSHSTLPPHLLKLELTESMLMHNIHDTIHKMETLRSYGVSFSIDDFGTGYSSLNYLRRLPIHELKIDRSFVQELPENTEDATIVASIVALAKQLRLSVIAEGVETTPQRDFLASIGCDQIQGYLFSRPISPQESAHMLQTTPQSPISPRSTISSSPDA